jgi:hypothetical protein
MCDFLRVHHDEFQSLSPIATILAAIVAASVTGVFAYLQYRIAKSQRDIAHSQRDIAQNKLNFDAFDKQYDRRVAVYRATRTFLSDVYDGNISEQTIKAYGLQALDAQFLFYDDPALYAYLKTIRDKVAMWHHAKMSADTLQAGDEKDEYARVAAEHLKWIQRQGGDYSSFDARFIPFLVYSVAVRSSPR